MIATRTRGVIIKSARYFFPLALVLSLIAAPILADAHSDEIIAGVKRVEALAFAGDLAGSLAELDRVERELLPTDEPRARITVLEERAIALMREPDGWERARDYLDEATRSAEAATPELRLLMMITRAQMAITAQRYDEALVTLRQLQAAPEIKNFIGLRIKAHIYLAAAAHYMGQFQIARDECLAGIALVAADRSPEASVVEARLRANLSLALYRLEDHAEALRNAEAAIPTLEARRSDRGCAEALATAYLTRAIIRRGSGKDYDAALTLLEHTYGPQSPALIPALTTKGWAMIDLGALDEASRALERGLELAKRNQMLPFFQLQLMEELTLVRLRQHRDEEAKQLAATMRDIWRDWLPAVIDAGSETDRLNLLMQCHWVDAAIAADDDEKAVEAITSSYGIVFESLLHEASLVARLPRDLLQRYRQSKARLAALTLRQSGKTNHDEIAELRRMVHANAGTMTLRAPEPKDIPAGSALVVFAPYRTLDGKPTERLAAAVITNQARHLIKISASRNAVRSAGDALVNALRPPANPAAAEEQLNDLREALLIPVRAVTGESAHLYLCLDGCMNRVPATLWTNATFLTSPQALLREPPRARPLAHSSVWLAINTGNKRITFPAGNRFPYDIANEFKDHSLPALPGADAETSELIQSPTQPWSLLRSDDGAGGGEPTEGTFVQQVADPPSVIHIAGHAAQRDPGIESASEVSSWWQGIDQPHVLWCSCLFFADPEPAEDLDDTSTDNLLFAAEVAGLDLKGTKLVTLSACDTGAGSSPMSEGHYSLARAFHQAGVRDVLSCTEPLPDASVAPLMKAFYERLAGGADAAKAFREEQERIIGGDVTKLRQYGFFRMTRAWVNTRP